LISSPARDARRGAASRVKVAAPRSRRAPPRCGLIVGILLACATAPVEAERLLNSGYLHACAILSRGQLKCWGYNSFGQLGLGHIVNIGDAAGEMGDDLPFVDLGYVDKYGRGLRVIS